MPTTTTGGDRLHRLKDIKTILRRLLISAGRTGITLPRLNGMFRENEDEDIPFKDFNCQNLKEFLQSMPDVVIIEYNREQVAICIAHRFDITPILDPLFQVLQELRETTMLCQHHNGIRKSDIIQKFNVRISNSINNIQILNSRLHYLHKYLVIVNDFIYFKEDFGCEDTKVKQTPSERIRLRLQRLMEKYPDGICAAKLPCVYKEEYSVDLDYHELGFNCITEFIATMPDLLSITHPDETGRLMILIATNPLNKIKQKQQSKSFASRYNFYDFITNGKQPLPTKLSAAVKRKCIPEGMMGLDKSVEHISVSSFSAEEFFEGYNSEIFTPNFFWITLRKDKSKIKKLMKDLGEFYKQQNLGVCRVPQAIFETGLNVACIYASMWHGAIVLKLKPDGHVTVWLCDYGTVKTYAPKDLYYLHKRFSVLPAQALACGLHNIKAPNGYEQWTDNSTNAFLNKVWGVPLIATVCETNETNNTMTITLTDTSDDATDLHLNEWMIDRGLAVRGQTGPCYK